MAAKFHMLWKELWHKCDGLIDG